MAISYMFPFLVGTTTERTGGTFTNLQAGWLYIETDGKAIYRWNGSSWDLIGQLSGTLGVTAGGTGATTLTGVLKGNGTSAITAAAQLAVADGGTGAGTLTGILKGNGTSAFTAVTAPSGAIVGDTDSQVLTNKTLTSPVISSISNTGTVTLPTSTDTLVGKATTDTLTNKTLTTPTITDPAVTTTIGTSTAFPSTLPSFDRKKWGRYNAFGSTASDGLFNGTMTAIASGTGATSGAIRSSTGLRYRHTTGGTANSLAGNRVTATAFTERDLNPWVEFRIQLSTVANMRAIMGFTSSTSAPASAADPLANLSGVQFFYDSGVDANWHIAQNSGGASSDRTTIANVAAADTVLRKFALRADNSNTKFQYSYDGAAWVDINTVIPAAGTGLGITWYIENLSGTVTIDTWYVQLIMDP